MSDILSNHLFTNKVFGEPIRRASLSFYPLYALHGAPPQHSRQAYVCLLCQNAHADVSPSPFCTRVCSLPACAGRTLEAEAKLGRREARPVGTSAWAQEQLVGERPSGSLSDGKQEGGTAESSRIVAERPKGFAIGYFRPTEETAGH